MAPPVLHRVIYGTTTPEPWQASLTKTYPALLQGFSRHKAKDLDYPGIIPAPSFHMNNTDTATSTPSVRGTLVTGLTEGDIWRLDIFEGDQYIRQPVRVKLLKPNVPLTASIDETHLLDLIEGEVEAETYVWVAPREELEEQEWDFEEFKREKMWAWIGEGHGDIDTEVDEGFGDVDRAVSEQNPKRDGTGGRGVNGGITRELERAAV